MREPVLDDNGKRKGGACYRLQYGEGGSIIIAWSDGYNDSVSLVLFPSEYRAAHVVGGM